MPVPPIPFKYKSQRLNSINTKELSELFSFFVRQLYFTNRYNEAFTFLQFSQLVFKEKNSDLMRQVLNAYKNYFTRGMKKRLLMDDVYEDHPHIWEKEAPKPKVFSIEKVLAAVEDEIREIQRANRNLFIPIQEIQLIAERKNLYIYSSLVITKSDEFISLDEGIMVSLTNPIGNKSRVTVLDYNKQTEILAFQTTQKLDFSEGKIKVSNAAVLYKLKEALEEIVLEGEPIQNLISGHVPQRLNSLIEPYFHKLDEIQQNSIQQALDHNVTFIWGPPGTGKSFTLSRLLVSLYVSGEKTLVSSTANVAIDGLLEKTAAVLDDIFIKERKDLAAEKKILRIGYSQSDRIRANDLFQIRNSVIDDFNFKLQRINEKLVDLSENADLKSIAKLKSMRDEIKQSLDNEHKKMLASARLIFATSAKIISDTALKSFDYDNIVVDEGSMMSLPYLLVLAAKVKKRIIIAGDFMQLGPIAASQSLRADRWLKADLFDYLADSHEKIISHSALVMLTKQRRMAKPIANLINEPFYQGKLQTVSMLSQSFAIDLPPEKGHVCFIETPHNEKNVAEVDPNSKSKYNKFSRSIVHQLLKEIQETHSRTIKSIGVIAPYKQQIIDYRNESAPYNESPLDIVFGTIHTFQGSECDIIIWDMVDTLQAPIGALYKERTGERLVNVAISRAKSKLIVVGQWRLFHEAKGSELVSSKLRSVISSLRATSLQIR